MLPQITLAVCYQDFVLDCQSRRLSSETLRYYRTQLLPFIAFCVEQDIEQPDKVTASLIRRYLVYVQEQGWKDTSLHAAARAIRRFFRFCANEEYIERAPKFTMPKLAKRIHPALTTEQAQKLVKACKTGRDRALLLLALDTGLRAQELTNLTVGDVNTQTGTVIVRSGKGGKDRMTHIGTKTRRAVNRYLTSRGQVLSTEPLWLNQRTGGRLSRWGIRELCDRLGQSTGIEVTPHMLRRTAALLALRSGLPLPMIQAMLGHGSLTTTERYLAFTDDDRREAHERFGGVDNLIDLR